MDERKAIRYKKHNFFTDVYAIVRQVPRGRVTTYGAIAAYLGTKMSARMVGWAMNAAHTDNTVPAHRVVNKSGLLTGRFHFATPITMQERLEEENIKVKGNQVEHFSEIFWNPNVNLL